MNLTRHLLLSALLLPMASVGFAANPWDILDKAPSLLAAEEIRIGPQRLVPDQSDPRVKSKKAVELFKREYADHKILSIQLIESRGDPVYRVKALSDAGVVKYVFVDGTSGDVFE